MPKEEKSLIESFMRIESYRHIFERYEEYEHKVMPGTITALGEALAETVPELPSKSLFMVGVPENVYVKLWEGFKETMAFHLLDPIAATGFDLWVIAAPQHKSKRVTWVVFPVTKEDFNEMRKYPRFAVIVVPISVQNFDELASRVDDVVNGLQRGDQFPASNGLILIIDISEIFSGG